MAQKNKNQNTKRFLQNFSNRSASEFLENDLDDDNDDKYEQYDDLYDEDSQIEKISNNLRKKLKNDF